MPRGNPSPKLAITVEPEVDESIVAAREALQRRAGLAAIAKWEKQHGRLSAEEMDQARRNVRAQLRVKRTVRRRA